MIKTIFDTIDIICTIGALFLAIKSFTTSKKLTLKANELSLKEQELSIKANELSQKNNLLAEADIEFQIASNIRETENRVSDISIELIKYKANKQYTYNESIEDSDSKKVTGSDKKEKSEDKIECAIKLAYNTAVESNLNAYEEACAKYLDGKVDKDRFKKNYHRQIRRLIEDSKPLMKYFDKPSSAYRCILKVYNEWYNLEKD